jgi:hypothetical protein
MPDIMLAAVRGNCQVESFDTAHENPYGNLIRRSKDILLVRQCSCNEAYFIRPPLWRAAVMCTAANTTAKGLQIQVLKVARQSICPLQSLCMLLVLGRAYAPLQYRGLYVLALGRSVWLSLRRRGYANGRASMNRSQQGTVPSIPNPGRTHQHKDCFPNGAEYHQAPCYRRRVLRTCCVVPQSLLPELHHIHSLLVCLQ